jgi:hypothetical protein
MTLAMRTQETEDHQIGQIILFSWTNLANIWSGYSFFETSRIPAHTLRFLSSFLLLDPHGLLLVHVCEHERDVAGEQVVHLVAERRLAEELGAPDEVADRHVEVGVARRPVGDARERVRNQNLLKRQ